MTDEEMADKHAEEYRKNFRYYRAWHGQVVDKSPSTIVDQSFKDGFLAGLKAGRPQWHDLRKDPNDLPKFRRDILVTCEYRSKLKKKCETFEWDYKSDMPLYAIAWCEIPTFDKE